MARDRATNIINNNNIIHWYTINNIIEWYTINNIIDWYTINFMILSSHKKYLSL